MIHIGNSWDPFFREEEAKPYYKELKAFLLEAYSQGPVYPSMENLFSVFREIPLEKVAVVILGQDPYHQPGQAHGLSFSVLPGVRKPPSILNIFKELEGDLGCPIPESGSLLGWARQGVFLLNTVLTVGDSAPGSHRGKGWETLTDRVIQLLAEEGKPKVFLLWGRDAWSKKSLIEGKGHLILESVHPSPLSAHRGFFGSRPFSKANGFLREKGRPEIDWCLR